MEIFSKMKHEEWNKSNNKKLQYIFAITLIFGIIIALWHFSGKTFKLFGAPKNKSLQNSFLSALSNVSAIEYMKNESTPQHKALRWITLIDTFHLTSSDVLLRKLFVMALFVISTFSQDQSDRYLSWFGTQPVCEWYGIKCTYLGEVQEIKIDDYNLDGYLPDELQEIKNLTILNVADNKLHGMIPKSYGHLKELQILDLSGNHLEGSIPETIFEIESIENLLLANNKLSSTLPNSIGEQPHIIEMKLNGNNLSGTLPYNIGNFSLLATFNLSSNK